MCGILLILLLLLLLLLLLFTALVSSPGGGSPYTSTDKPNKNNYTWTKQYKNSTNNTKHSKYKYTYYQNTPTYIQQHITKQVQTTTVQDTHQMK